MTKETFLQTVVKAAIHPAIGIARLGNSTNECFVGPETLGYSNPPAGTMRDATGALKRQAARFRIYGYNAKDEVVTELTAENADLEWTVHICNKKAAWYRFAMALDIPEAQKIVVARRNPDVEGKRRDQLILDPGPVSISDKDGFSKEIIVSLENSLIPPVYLGELRLESTGRLLFLGGRGKSFSPEGRPIWDGSLQEYPSGDGWFDDVSDGPVSAVVTIQGRSIPVEAAWVITAPPDYAPGLTSVRTLYDLLVDVYIRAGWWEFPKRISFAKDVYPILLRLTRLQWVNKGFAAQFGIGAPHDFTNLTYLRKLSSASTIHAEVRRQVFNAFRNPEATDNTALPWPWLYGDAMVLPGPAPSARQHQSLSHTQYRILKHWAEGLFEEDLGFHDLSNPRLEELSLTEQPHMLDQAALTFCVADAFHPGCEVTWPMRNISMYKAPFRFRHKEYRGKESAAFGPLLTQEGLFSPNGPLYDQGPGDLTRWLALPWQVSVTLCRSGYDPEYDPYLPTFWPAIVPNQVLTVDSYQKVTDERLPRIDRLAAFAERQPWTRNLKGTLLDQMTQMVSAFDRMGVIEGRAGVLNDPELPSEMLVETLSVSMESETGLSNERTILLKLLVEQAQKEAQQIEVSEWEAMQETDAFTNDSSE